MYIVYSYQMKTYYKYQIVGSVFIVKRHSRYNNNIL